MVISGCIKRDLSRADRSLTWAAHATNIVIHSSMHMKSFILPHRHISMYSSLRTPAHPTNTYENPPEIILFIHNLNLMVAACCGTAPHSRHNRDSTTVMHAIKSVATSNTSICNAYIYYIYIHTVYASWCMVETLIHVSSFLSPFGPLLPFVSCQRE